MRERKWRFGMKIRDRRDYDAIRTKKEEKEVSGVERKKEVGGGTR